MMKMSPRGVWCNAALGFLKRFATRAECFSPGESPRVTPSTWYCWRVSACLLALVAVGFNAAAQLTNSAASPAQPTNRPAPSVQEATLPITPDYNFFKLVADRNIFNANRNQGRPSGARRAPVVETVSLEGTMSYEQGQFAFFEGATVKPEGTVSGFKVLSITQSGVMLDAGTNQLQGVTVEENTNTVELKVGYQLRREDDGPWLMAMNTASSSSGDRSSAFRGGGSGRGGGNGGNTYSRSSSTSSSAASGSTGGTGANPNDVLQRLMQQRAAQAGGQQRN